MQHTQNSTVCILRCQQMVRIKTRRLIYTISDALTRWPHVTLLVTFGGNGIKYTYSGGARLSDGCCAWILPYRHCSTYTGDKQANKLKYSVLLRTIFLKGRRFAQALREGVAHSVRSVRSGFCVLKHHQKAPLLQLQSRYLTINILEKKKKKRYLNCACADRGIA